MRAFYYLFFILFNNLLSIHIHTCGDFFFWGGGLAPKPLMNAAYEEVTYGLSIIGTDLDDRE